MAILNKDTSIGDITDVYDKLNSIDGGGGGISKYYLLYGIEPDVIIDISHLVNTNQDCAAYIQTELNKLGSNIKTVCIYENVPNITYTETSLYFTTQITIPLTITSIIFDTHEIQGNSNQNNKNFLVISGTTLNIYGLTYDSYNTYDGYSTILSNTATSGSKNISFYKCRLEGNWTKIIANPNNSNVSLSINLYNTYLNYPSNPCILLDGTYNSNSTINIKSCTFIDTQTFNTDTINRIAIYDSCINYYSGGELTNANTITVDNSAIQSYEDHETMIELLSSTNKLYLTNSAVLSINYNNQSTWGYCIKAPSGASLYLANSILAHSNPNNKTITGGVTDTDITKINVTETKYDGYVTYYPNIIYDAYYKIPGWNIYSKP